MNIYKGVRIPESHRTPDYLATTASNFANVLAAGRWRQKGIHKVELTRSIAETMGSELELGEEYVEPIFSEIMLSFSAVKRYIEDYSGGALVPHYNIMSTTQQEVSKKEIPTEVLDEIFQEAQEEEHPIHDVLDDMGMGDTDLSPDNLDDFEIKRIQEEEYSFNHLGEIDEYSTSYRYSFDDIIVHEVGLSHVSDELFWHPIRLSGGTMRERKPTLLKTLSGDAMRKELEGIDPAFEEFLMTQSHPELTVFNALPKEEHIRRILGMISMLSDGFIDLRSQKPFISKR